MKNFKDISDADIKSIMVPVFVINGDKEVVLAEHALKLSHALPNAQLAILPGGHGDYIGETAQQIRTVKYLIWSLP
jgi:pimeloyl-ACP methyl ester carboxylesterase